MMRVVSMFLALCFAAAPAWAGEMTSTYTKLNVEKCQKGESSEEEGWATWTCTGYQGLPIYFAHADLREYVGYGADAKNSCSARTTFQRFNAAGKTIEWRLRAGQPVATILRFYVDGDGKKEQFLLVTKLDGSGSCPMGYVDARTPNHNQAARDLLDANIDGFSCARDEPLVISSRYGQPGEFARGGSCDP